MAIIDLLNIKKLYDNQSRVEGAGQVVGSSYITSQEFGNSACHETILTLNNLPVSVVSVTTGNGVGGTKIYQMNAGYMRFMGGTANLSLSIAAGKQADFTDATPEGSLGVGTLAPANADALGTDSTDDNICTATAFVCAAYADTSITLPPEADLLLNGTSSAIGVFLNAFVGSADIDDGVTTEVLVSGTVHFFWQNLGDY